MVFTSNATDVEHHTTFLIQMDVVFDFSELQDLWCKAMPYELKVL